MKGYYNDEVQTERKLKGGYLHTGDYGRITAVEDLLLRRGIRQLSVFLQVKKYAEMS